MLVLVSITDRFYVVHAHIFKMAHFLVPSLGVVLAFTRRSFQR